MSTLKPSLFFLLILAILFCSTACHRKAVPKPSEVITSPDPTTTQGVEPPATTKDAGKSKKELDVAPKPAYLMLWMVKTPCYGECPVFEFKIYSDGRALWHGEHYCERIGYHEAFVPLGWRSQIMERAKGIRFFALEDKYPVSGPELFDLPQTFLYFNDGKQEKSISHQYLSPSELIDFEEAVTHIVDGMHWEKLNGEE